MSPAELDDRKRSKSFLSGSRLTPLSDKSPAVRYVSGVPYDIFPFIPFALDPFLLGLGVAFFLPSKFANRFLMALASGQSVEISTADDGSVTPDDRELEYI